MMQWITTLITRLAKLLGELARDESGASLIEYTVLVGILTVAVISTVTLVGSWIANRWDALHDALPS